MPHQRRVVVTDFMRFITLAVDGAGVASRVNTGADIVAAEVREAKVGDVVGSVVIVEMGSAVAVEGARSEASSEVEGDVGSRSKRTRVIC